MKTTEMQNIYNNTLTTLIRLSFIRHVSYVSHTSKIILHQSSLYGAIQILKSSTFMVIFG